MLITQSSKSFFLEHDSVSSGFIMHVTGYPCICLYSIYCTLSILSQIYCWHMQLPKLDLQAYRLPTEGISRLKVPLRNFNPGQKWNAASISRREWLGPCSGTVFEMGTPDGLHSRRMKKSCNQMSSRWVWFFLFVHCWRVLFSEDLRMHGSVSWRKKVWPCMSHAWHVKLPPFQGILSIRVIRDSKNKICASPLATWEEALEKH